MVEPVRNSLPASCTTTAGRSAETLPLPTVRMGGRGAQRGEGVARRNHGLHTPEAASSGDRCPDLTCMDNKPSVLA